MAHGVVIRRGSVDAGAFTARRRQALGYIRVSLKLAPRRSDYEAGFGLVAYRYCLLYTSRCV